MLVAALRNITRIQDDPDVKSSNIFSPMQSRNPQLKLKSFLNDKVMQHQHES